MKNTLLIFAALLPFFSDAQITVKPYTKEIKCDINVLYELPPLEAVSEFGTVTTTLDEEIFSGGCLGILVRTFTFTDKLDNKATAQQFVTILDNEPPRLYGVPADIKLSRDKIKPATEVSSRDNSGSVYPVTFTEENTGTQLIRTWSCTDACGNVVNGKQVITIEN